MNHSVEAEQAVIGGILREPGKFDAVSELLRSEDFARADHRLIFTAIVDLVVKGNPVDAITLCDRLEATGDLARVDHGYVLDLALNTPSAANIVAYARIVQDKSRRRQLAEAMHQMAEAATTSDEPLDKLVAAAAAQIGALQRDNRLNLLRDTNEVLKGLVSTLDRRLTTQGIDGIPTGLKALDARYMGWKGGDLIILAARPSMGKSALAFQIGMHNALAGRKVMAFSLEMTAEQILERCVANIGGISLTHLRDPRLDNGGELWTRLSMAVGKLRDMPMIIDETPGLHVNQICARARAEHQKSPVSIVVVDHLNIVAGDGQSRERELASITGGLKGLAKELSCPVLALCQLNRKVEERANKRPLMSDLRDSGAIEQDADIVTLLYRDEYYNDDSPNKGVLEVITGKFRQGEVGTDYCAAKLFTSTIGDLAHEFEPSKPAGKFEY